MSRSLRVRDPQFHAKFVGRQCEAMASIVRALSVCLHGCRYAEFVGNEIRPQWRHTSRSLRVRDPQFHAKFVGRQCEAMASIGKSTKRLPAWMQVCRIRRERNSAAVASYVMISASLPAWTQICRIRRERNLAAIHRLI